MLVPFFGFFSWKLFLPVPPSFHLSNHNQEHHLDLERVNNGLKAFIQRNVN